MSESETRSRGIVKFFSSKKGFGFITPEDGSRDVFVSERTLARDQSLLPNDRVEYVLGEGRKGPFAKEVKVL